MTEALEVRAPETKDAHDISQLFLERYDDIIPGRQSWKPMRKRYFAKYGEGYFVDRITRAIAIPTENFACVATVDNEVVGFASATTSPYNRVLARLVGLVVDTEYQRHKIGTRMEIERQGWADVNDKVLYGQIAYEDDAAWAFYKTNGYREVGTRALAETVFRVIEHTPPNSPFVSDGVHWDGQLSDEPLIY